MDQGSPRPKRQRPHSGLCGGMWLPVVPWCCLFGALVVLRRWELTDRALRQYPYTLSATSVGQDVSRGGFVRLEGSPPWRRCASSSPRWRLRTGPWSRPRPTRTSCVCAIRAGTSVRPCVSSRPKDASTARGGAATTTSTGTTRRCTTGRTPLRSRRGGGYPDRPCRGLRQSLAEVPRSGRTGRRRRPQRHESPSRRPEPGQVPPPAS